MRNSTLTIRPMAGVIGAEILDIDVTRDHAEGTWLEIRQALNEYGVIFFRDQTMDRAQHQAFARRFGEIGENVSEVVKEVDQVRNVGGGWHADLTWQDEPPLGAVLVARELPARGGDTMFASMCAAYDALSDGLKRTLEGLRAIHANVRQVGPHSARVAPREVTEADYDRAEGPSHPVVARHPETGRKLLFVNSAYTARFEGWTRRESLPLLNHLYQHGQRPEFTCRFTWRPGSVAFWDNRQVWHLAVNDYHGMRRAMDRIAIAGARPR